MDIVEFAEKFMDVKLKEWQKEQIRILDKLPRGARIVMAPRGRVYIYVNQPMKELIPNGKTHDS
jgi:hypothetical protein